MRGGAKVSVDGIGEGKERLGVRIKWEGRRWGMRGTERKGGGRE